MRWWRWWRVGIRSSSFLPRWHLIRRLRRACENLCRQICWFPSDLGSWRVFQGEIFDWLLVRRVRHLLSCCFVAWFAFSNPLNWWWWTASLFYVGWCSSMMLLQQFINLVLRCEWLLRSKKPGIVRAFAGRCPFPLLFVQCNFNLWREAYNRRKNKPSM